MWMYHPDCPEGKIFDDRQLAEEWDEVVAAGWTDTHRKLPGGLREGEPPDRPTFSWLEPEEPTEDPVNRIDLKVSQREESRQAVKREVLPEDYESIVDFMDAFGKASGIENLEGNMRQAALKIGVEQYSRVKYGQGIDRRKAAETLMDEILNMETQ